MAESQEDLTITGRNLHRKGAITDREQRSNEGKRPKKKDDGKPEVEADNRAEESEIIEQVSQKKTGDQRDEKVQKKMFQIQVRL